MADKRFKQVEQYLQKSRVQLVQAQVKLGKCEAKQTIFLITASNID